MSVLHEQGHVTVAITLPEIDIRTAPAFAEELQAALEKTFAEGARHLTLDLDAVTFIDSMGVGALIDAQRAAGARDCRMDVTNVHRPVLMAFDVLGLVEAFGVH
jgi:anti-sigma B factor antagonist